MQTLFTLTLFLSALLLFWIQPMFSKMILPLLGGTPSVWNTCMVFYQTTLLAGYAYAHLITRRLPIRRQILLHGVLLVAALWLLPIAAAKGWSPPTQSNPILWLLGLLSVSIGLLFFLLSATAPLLQKWFSEIGHAESQDPYFLYVASNLGSMIALLSYPVLIEPNLRLAKQSQLWSAGYILLAILIAVCAVKLLRSQSHLSTHLSPESGEAVSLSPISNAARFRWLLLSFTPSSLLLGITTYLTTDIAAVPLLWIIPLLIYLLTFVLVFARKPLLSHKWLLRIQPILIVLMMIFFSLGLRSKIWREYLLHLLTFFVTAMICHGELAKSRPPAHRLTEFYLILSAGGALGGMFNALLAPLLFNTPIEYPLVLVLACLLRPQLDSSPTRLSTRILDFLIPLVLVLAVPTLVWRLHSDPHVTNYFGLITLSVLIGILSISYSSRPIRFGLCIGVMAILGIIHLSGQLNVIYIERSFFGIMKVTNDSQGKFHQLFHGTTIHGIQNMEPENRREPLAYYSRRGPLGQAIREYFGDGKNKQLALIGLGSGIIACYGEPSDHLTFYEIDPLVERIARNPQYFTYLSDCPADYRVILGDARLSLVQAPEHSYDMLILDAFSSDSIPVHLLTREALQLYLAKIKEEGILVFHISNKFIDIKPVLDGLARDARLVGFIRNDNQLSNEEKQQKILNSQWVVLARTVASLGKIPQDTQWSPLAKTPTAPVWTDDYTHIIRLLKYLQ